MDAAFQRLKQRIRPAHIFVALMVLVLPVSVYVTGQQTNLQQHADTLAQPIAPSGNSQAAPPVPLSETPTAIPTPTPNLDFLP